MLPARNYFEILQVEPSASTAEIKKAYRRLALQYHPDKHPNDPGASVQFAAIKEAYEVLTNPAKKEHYLQQRWYQQSTGNRKSRPATDPVNFLKQAIELEKYVSALDVFRMDKSGLEQYILEWLSKDEIQKLHSFRDPETIHEAIRILLRATKALPASHTAKIMERLHLLAGENQRANEIIRQHRELAQRKYQREKYGLLVISLITFLLCLLIWLGSR